MGKTRHFKSWISAYANWTQGSEAPADFHRWVAVATIAGALRRYVWIDQLDWKWIPNFYVLLVAPPGVATKSTTISVGEKLLRQVPGVDFAPEAGTYEGLIASMDKRHRLTNSKSDWSGDWLVSTCRNVFIGELGTFLDTKNDKQVSAFTNLWDNRERFEKGTKTSGDEYLINPYINLIAGTTPEWLSKHFPDSMIGDGLASRIVWVYGDRKRDLRAYSMKSEEDRFKYLEKEKQLVEDLCLIGEMRGEFFLTKEALEWGTNWYKALWTRHPEHLKNARFGGYIARRQSHLHKVAIILSASSRNDQLITQRDLELAEGILFSMERQMLLCFGSIGQTPLSRCIGEIIAILKLRNGMATMRQIFQYIPQGRYNGQVIGEAFQQLYYTKRATFIGPKSPDQGVKLND